MALAQPGKFLRRHQVWIVALLLIFVCGAALVWTRLRSSTDPRLEKIRARGHPINLAQLNSWYLSPAANENAANVYTQVLASAFFDPDTRASAWLDDREWQLPPGAVLPDERRPELRQLLEGQKDALEKLHSVTFGARARYPVNLEEGFLVKLPHLGRIKTAIRLLSAECILCGSDGATHQAVQSLAAGATIAESLRDEPLLLSSMVRVAGWSILIDRLQWLLSVRPLEPADLDLLDRILAAAENPEVLTRALAAELAQGISTFDDPAAGAAFLNGGPNSSGSSSDFKWTFLSSVLKVSGVYGRDRAFFIDRLNTSVEASQQPHPLRLELANRDSTNTVPSRFYIVSSMLLPALGRVISKDAVFTARVRAARIAVLVEKYRTTHNGALPGSIAEAFAGNSPLVDPYTGVSMIFSKRGDGYVVYSVGADLKDDGGDVESVPVNGSSSRRSQPKDVGFVVKR